MAPPASSWLIVNPGSGSTGEAAEASIVEGLALAGLPLAGRTSFPDEPLPDAAFLSARGVDMVAIFSGDGTMNAVARHLADWPGRLLPLPGGTMNLLPGTLHGSRDLGAILADLSDARPVRLPVAEAGGHRAFCRLIVGPLAAFVFAREAARDADPVKGWRAIRYAIARARTGGVRVSGIADLAPRPAKAVVVYPAPDRLEVAAVGLSGLLAAARVGIAFLTGEFREAPDVSTGTATAFTVNGGRTMHGLFDGEEQPLASPLAIRHAVAANIFLATDPECPACST